MSETQRLPRSSVRFRAHRGEQQNIADGGAVGQEHDETVNAEAEAARGGQAVFQSGNIVVINLGFAVGLDGLALSNLALKTCFLVDGVIQLAECVAILGAVNEILKPLSKRRVIGLALGQRADFDRTRYSDDMPFARTGLALKSCLYHK